MGRGYMGIELVKCYTDAHKTCMKGAWLHGSRVYLTYGNCTKGAWNRSGDIKLIATIHRGTTPLATAHDLCTKGAWLCATTAIGSVIFH